MMRFKLRATVKTLLILVIIATLMPWIILRYSLNKDQSTKHIQRNDDSDHFVRFEQEGKESHNEQHATEISGNGLLNIHMWVEICSYSINSVRQFPHFPLRPNKREYFNVSNALKIITKDKWSARRIMGYLHPPITGNYLFALSTIFTAELWVSTSKRPQHSQRITFAQQDIHRSFFNSKGEPLRMFNTLHFESGKKYYFEILHIMNDNEMDVVDLQWKPPGHGYRRISSEYVSRFLNDKESNVTADHLLELSPSVPLHVTHMSSAIYGSEKLRSESISTIPYMERTDLMMAFPNCLYEPSYMRKRDYKRYEGVWAPDFSAVFPNDRSWNMEWQNCEDETHCSGNPVIGKSEVEWLVATFMESLRDTSLGKYSLIEVVNVERKDDKEKGSRYFVDLVVLRHSDRKLFRISEYMFLFYGTSQLCLPSGMIWSRNSTVNVILTAKKQGHWLQHFIYDMARVIRETRDNHVRVIVVDYGDNGFDVEDELKRSGIKNFAIVKIRGKFHKTFAIQQAASYIKDDNSIVFLADLHLRMPSNIIESIRRHTVQGMMSFTPVVFRLDFCGRPSSKETPQSIGQWETYGYGIFSIYKSDWDRFGGMNVEEYEDKWGGEDWEMADSVLNTGIEIERLRIPGFYHFFHSKSGMWEQSQAKETFE